MAPANALANGKHPAQEAGQRSGEQRETDEEVGAADASAGASASAADTAQAAEGLDALQLTESKATGSVGSADVKDDDVSSAAQVTASEVLEPAKDTDIEAGEGQGAQLSMASEAAGTACQAGAVREAALVTSSEDSVPARHADVSADVGKGNTAAASADKLRESPKSADMEADTV